MKFSIIMAGYNVEKKVKRSIESVINQDFVDYEFIFVNDCSTDKTIDIVSKYKQVKLINNEHNLKAGGARNVGLNNAKGEYIVFLDADDIFINSKVLKKIDNNIEANNHPDIVYLGFETIEKQIIPSKNNSTKKERIEEWKYANVWDVCWNRNFLNKNNIRFVENRFFEDFPFYYEGIIKSNTYSYIEEPIIRYTTEQSDSMTRNLNIDKIKDFYQNMNLLLDLYTKIEEDDLRHSFERGALLRQSDNISYYIKKMIDINK